MNIIEVILSTVEGTPSMKNNGGRMSTLVKSCLTNYWTGSCLSKIHEVSPKVSQINDSGMKIDVTRT